MRSPHFPYSEGEELHRVTWITTHFHTKGDKHMGNRWLTFLLLVLIMGLACQAWALEAESGWRVGLAVAKITPEQPIRMAGYSDRTQPSQSVSSDLHAKAMALED